MRKFLLAILLFPALAFAQSAPRYDSVVQSPTGQAIAGASIAVCTQPAITSTLPCSTLATLYPDSSGTTYTISSIVRTGDVVTVTTSVSNTVPVGQWVTIAGVTDSSYDGTFQTTAQSGSTFQFNQVGVNSTSSGGTVAGANPTFSSGLGNYFFYAAYGNGTQYTVQIYGNNITTQVKPDQVYGTAAGAPSLAGNNAFTGNNTHTGTETFANINNVLYMGGTLYPCSTVGFTNILAAIASTGGTVNAQACNTAFNVTSALTVGASTQPITVILPPTTITFTNTSGDGFDVRGSSVVMRGQGSTSTIIACGSGFTGKLFDSEPAAGQVVVHNVELHDVRLDQTACPTAQAINIRSTAEQSYVEGVTALGGTGTMLHVGISGNSGAEISQHINFRDDVIESGSGTLTANTVMASGNQMTFGPDFYVVNIGTPGSFSGVLIEPSSSGNGDGQGNTFFASSIAGYTGAPCLIVSSISGALAIGNAIGPGNTFENCQGGYEFTGVAANLSSGNYGIGNFFPSSTTSEAKIDYGQDNTIIEKTNGDGNDVVLTANSVLNRVQTIGSTTDVSDSGSENSTDVLSSTGRFLNKVTPASLSLAALLASATAPTISSGFGTTPSIVQSNGTAAFEVNVGTGGVATSGVIGLPTAAHGWTCSVTDQTTNSKTTFQSANTVSSVTVTATVAWAASDVLLFQCSAF